MKNFIIIAARGANFFQYTAPIVLGIISATKSIINVRIIDTITTKVEFPSNTDSA